MNWIADGRRDDTPPGGALVFELWKTRTTEDYQVRVYFTVQTLEQMRLATPLTLETPPQRVPVFLPGCSRSDFSCSWTSFSRLIGQTSRKDSLESRHTASVLPKPSSRSSQ